MPPKTIKPLSCKASLVILHSTFQLLFNVGLYHPHSLTLGILNLTTEDFDLGSL